MLAPARRQCAAEDRKCADSVSESESASTWTEGRSATWPGLTSTSLLPGLVSAFVSSSSPSLLFSLANNHASRAIRIGDHGKREQKQGGRDLARSMHQVLPLGTSPCDATGRLEMKVEFRYVQPVSAFPNTSTPFCFFPRLVRAKLIQKRWARLRGPISTPGLALAILQVDDYRALPNDPEPRRLSGLRARTRTWTWRSRRYINALAFYWWLARSGTLESIHGISTAGLEYW